MTLLLGTTFLHIRGDLAVLGRPHVIGGEKYEQTNFGIEPSPKTKELRHIGVYSAARLLGPEGLIGYLRDDMFLLLKEFISFFLLYLNLVILPKALTCARKQNSKGIWFSKMTSSCKRFFLESHRIWLSHAN